MRNINQQHSLCNRYEKIYPRTRPNQSSSVQPRLIKPWMGTAALSESCTALSPSSQAGKTTMATTKFGTTPVTSLPVIMTVLPTKGAHNNT